MYTRAGSNRWPLAHKTNALTNWATRAYILTWLLWCPLGHILIGKTSLSCFLYKMIYYIKLNYILYTTRLLNNLFKQWRKTQSVLDILLRQEDFLRFSYVYHICFLLNLTTEIFFKLRLALYHHYDQHCHRLPL